ncbi:uroporphyrinogen-III C-methyltransferase [Ascoidea rubescens DSM 1968]|uniref:Uroporphyrin-III C-methyltransferase n=1 Tax=Ascoidea rubescens DSM 1968 TaxID=1344418 RepID=A0A1D2V9D7_9ASCO|nr:uroporphyrin-III C-methyltransferase [Ascoidea rubescens DSM 1968]ODV58125.1 uroporphyrin-III C-methyltransferase [Ascoidea rubescens DSM 1968]
MVKLLVGLNCEDERHLLIGTSGISLFRLQMLIENKVRPIILIPYGIMEVSSTLREYILENKNKGIVEVIEIESEKMRIGLIEKIIKSVGRERVGRIIDRVFVTLGKEYEKLKREIYGVCIRLRIPINITDEPGLCSFTMLSSYKDGDFQVGLTTNGKGCRLASKLKRDIVSKLPKNLSGICDNIGKLKKRIQEDDKSRLDNENSNECNNNSDGNDYDNDYDNDNEEDILPSNGINKIYDKDYREENLYRKYVDEEELKLQRTRWLSQIIEYFPLEKLSEICIDELSLIYKDKEDQLALNKKFPDISTFHGEISIRSKKPEKLNRKGNGNGNGYRKKGKISLIGSGPGSISMLTIGAIKEMYSADLILADKLISKEVLELISKDEDGGGRKREIYIAKKFPGNAERAQKELLEKGLVGLQKGLKVIRLKQGDPYIFGRGGEEYQYFRDRGYRPLIVPGLSSSMVGPILADIPVTHRKVSDQFIVSTGTVKDGKFPANIPRYNEHTTVILLMVLHRLREMVGYLVGELGYDTEVPCCIVERASSPDQRIIRSQLKNVVEAFEVAGSRPPGLLVIGHTCDLLHGHFGGKSEQHGEHGEHGEPPKWIVEEGYSDIDVNIADVARYIQVSRWTQE